MKCCADCEKVIFSWCIINIKLELWLIKQSYPYQYHNEINSPTCCIYILYSNISIEKFLI